MTLRALIETSIRLNFRTSSLLRPLIDPTPFGGGADGARLSGRNPPATPPPQHHPAARGVLLQEEDLHVHDPVYRCGQGRGRPGFSDPKCASFVALLHLLINNFFQRILSPPHPHPPPPSKEKRFTYVLQKCPNVESHPPHTYLACVPCFLALCLSTGGQLNHRLFNEEQVSGRQQA